MKASAPIKFPHWICLLLFGFAVFLPACYYDWAVNPRRNIPYSSLPYGLGKLQPVSENGQPGVSDNTQAVVTGPLSLTLQSAVLMTLENNAGFQVERLKPAVSRTEEQVQRAVFDPTLSASLSGKHSSGDSNLFSRNTGDGDSVSAKISLKELLPTGTTVELGTSGETGYSENDTDSRKLNWDATVTQALLRGRGLDVNLARLQQTGLDTDISAYELQGAAEALVTQVEQGYWDYILAERSIEIYEQSLGVAEQQAEEVKERIRVGKVAETELAAAEAESASRREQLIQASGTLAKRRLNLIRLLNPDGESVWTREIVLSDTPEIPALLLDSVEAHLQVAVRQRADLNQARLRLRRGDLEVAYTRNGLLPKLDFFVRLGGSRYANSFSDRSDEKGTDISYTAGLNLEIPLGNRAADARHERALLAAGQTRAALHNMEQLVQVDVRSAYVDVERTSESVKATEATQRLRQKTLEIEGEKFRLGKSTSFLVSQARRDVVASQIAAVEAVIGYRKALLDLYRLEGSLLPRWGIK